MLAIALGLYACQTTPQTALPSAERSLRAAVVDPAKIVTGQTVYVPVYSHIYQHSNRNPVLNLSATLSIRNTDLVNPIVIRSVRYYDDHGELIKTYLEQPVELPRLGSIDYLVETEDTRGGLGANFIVEWVAETSVSEPVIEALMLNTSGNQGISFISLGRVIQRQGKPSPA